jgi:hypothetical protein
LELCVGSSFPFRVEFVGALFGVECLALQMDLFLGGLDTGFLRLLFGSLRSCLLRVALGRRGSLLMPCMLLGLALGVTTLPLNPSLTLLGGDFVLEPLALDLRFNLLLVGLRFGLGTPRFGGVLLRLALGFGLGLL